jgi:large subunit ribosomal protein L24e
MPRCDFCRKNIEPGTGKMIIKNDGKVVDLCSTKCEKNMIKLRRKPRTTPWTVEFANVKKGMKK